MSNRFDNKRYRIFKMYSMEVDEKIKNKVSCIALLLRFSLKNIKSLSTYFRYI